MPSHSHTYYAAIYDDTSGTGTATHYKGPSRNTGSTGGSSSHTHSLSGTATIALNVKYTDVIICSKN